MKVGCLLSDWALQDQAKAMPMLWVLRQQRNPQIQVLPFLCHPRDGKDTASIMGCLGSSRQTVLWGQVSIPLFKAWLQLMASGQGQLLPA